MTKQNLLIVDGDGLLVRSHYAVGKEIYTRTDIEVGGVDKFIHVLRRQIRAWNVDFVYIAFDPDERNTLRQQQYAQYKSNREERPSGLVYSKSILLPILKAMGATVHIDNRYEGDDLVAAMVHQTKDCCQCIVSTHDKDLLWLLNYEHVKVAPPFQIDVVDSEYVRNKFFIEPSQMLDYLALLGDSADNIPGVPGCGKQRASMLLQKYKTLEAILEAAQNKQIAGKMGEQLQLLSKRTLAFRNIMRFYTDAPMPDWHTCAIGEPDYPKLLALLMNNNLQNLYNEALSNSKSC